MISRPGRLRTSEIPIPLLVSSAVKHLFFLSFFISLGGADFEIIPTNIILPSHHSVHFHPWAGCFFHDRQVRTEKSEATRPIPWYQDQADYAPLRSRWRCWWARRWRIIAIIGLHCLVEIGTLSQNRYWFWQRKLAQLFYLSVSLFCTRSRGLVLKPQSLPHQVHVT